MTQLKGVATVWLPVTDMQRASASTPTRSAWRSSSRRTSGPSSTADELTIGLNAREESPAGDGGAVVAFAPDGELEQAVEDLGAKGVQFADGISDHPWGPHRRLPRPDGNALQLYTPPK
jgi:hypothetical protein